MYREYYHQKLAPSSDVDLFIYGLDEAAAVEKIKQIETRIHNSILSETTASHTSYAYCTHTDFCLDHSNQKCNYHSFSISDSAHSNSPATIPIGLGDPDRI